MTNRILKGLAVAAGTGLAMGFTSGRARVNYAPYRRRPSNGHAESVFAAAVADAPVSQPAAASDFRSDDFLDDDVLDIEPLLDRLEKLEARVDSIVNQQAPPEPATPRAADNSSASYAAAIADLERRVDENSRELELLRQSITEAETRMTASVASVERRLEQTRSELPALVEPKITARIDDLRSRFTAEIEQANRRTLEVFERAIDEKLSSRIGSIEKALAVQAGSIEALNVRAAETDNNLQRLVTAIEKLCERTQLLPLAPEQQSARAPLARSPQFEVRAPFESQLHEAMENGPAVPVLRTEEPAPVTHDVPAFANAGSTTQAEPKKSRSFFRSLIVAVFGVLATRFLR